jgi:hypothetical protein
MAGGGSWLSGLAQYDIISVNYPPALTLNYCILNCGTEKLLQFLLRISISTTTTTTTTTTTLLHCSLNYTANSFHTSSMYLNIITL